MTRGNETATDMRAVVVTTEHRGVFFGRIPNDTPLGADPLVLTGAQMCVYWDVSTKGVLGLAANGPTEKCRITAPVPAIELRSITAIMTCTDEAAEAWAAQPWAN